jgi:hypothetical protein
LQKSNDLRNKVSGKNDSFSPTVCNSHATFSRCLDDEVNEADFLGMFQLQVFAQTALFHLIVDE